MAKKIKIACVGAGWVMNNRHLPALKQSGLFEVVGVVSCDLDRARQTAAKFGIPNVATQLDCESGWQAEIEAIDIGKIPGFHYPMAMRALSKGKHVLTEKPMTVKVAEAEDLVETARRAGLTLAVVHNFQFSRAALSFQRDLEQGRIGQVRAIYGVQLCNDARRIPQWCHDLPFGLFYDESPHFYYLFRFLSGGQPTFLQASTWPSTRPDRNTPQYVTAEYRSAAGHPIHLHINFESSLTEWHVYVVGSQATVDIDVWRDIYTYLPNDGSHRPWEILRTGVLACRMHLTGAFTGGLRYLAGRHLYGNDEVVGRFADAVRRGLPGPPSISGDDGLQVVRLQHELMAKTAVVETPR